MDRFLKWLTQRRVFHQGDRALTLYDGMMLKKKVEGRPCFQVLTWRSSKREIDDEAACRYIFDRGKMKRMILLRIRSVQGHPGEAMQNISRVGHEIVGQDKIPLLLAHSTMSVHL